MTSTTGYVAIVDYGLGNIFSVLSVCERLGCKARLTSNADEIMAAGGVILPGVGAFATAMKNLEGLGLVPVLREVINKGKPFLGICLGMQLLFAHSHEFGVHPGLGILPGEVLRLPSGLDERGRPLKIPEVGWSKIHAAGADVERAAFSAPFLSGIVVGSHMYFVHSFYVKPFDPGLVASLSKFGDLEYCSSISRGKLMACQFHPERSGELGMKIYANFFAGIQPA